VGFEVEHQKLLEGEESGDNSRCQTGCDRHEGTENKRRRIRRPTSAIQDKGQEAERRKANAGRGLNGPCRLAAGNKRGGKKKKKDFPQQGDHRSSCRTGGGCKESNRRVPKKKGELGGGKFEGTQKKQARNTVPGEGKTGTGGVPTEGGKGKERVPTLGGGSPFDRVGGEMRVRLTQGFKKKKGGPMLLYKGPSRRGLKINGDRNR